MGKYIVVEADDYKGRMCHDCYFATEEAGGEPCGGSTLDKEECYEKLLSRGDIKPLTPQQVMAEDMVKLLKRVLLSDDKVEYTGHSNYISSKVVGELLQREIKDILSTIKEE